PLRGGSSAPRRGHSLRPGVAQASRLALLTLAALAIAGSSLAATATATATATKTATKTAKVTATATARSSTPRVLAIRFGPDLAVNPVTQHYLNHQLEEAAKHYDAAVILLDTPGGLSSSLRAIYQKELALKVPVIVYVSPSGARAASAGVWISESAD